MSPNRPMRILVVDDDPTDAELMVALLRRDGISLIVDRLDTLTAFRQRIEAGECDAILADHNLQSWTAMDALNWLRQSGREIPFIVVTGTLGDEQAVEYLKRGANDYVLKEHLERLPAALRRALQGKVQRDENIRLQWEIRKSKEDWERTFEAIPDSIMLLDRERHILRANAATGELAGVDTCDLIGTACFRGVHKLLEPAPGCPLQRMLISGKAEEAEITDHRLKKILHIAAVPLRNGEGEVAGAIHVMRDITERKQFEHEMLQAQKLEAIGRLAGGVAHDFNNILGVIQGYSELAEEQIPETDSTLRQHVSEIRKAASRGAGVTRQLLAFSRKQVMQLKAVRLTDVITDLEKMLQSLIGENIQLVVSKADDLGIVNVDPVQIQQVLMNLAINARDAMPNGGKLSISASNVTLDAEPSGSNDVVVSGEYVLVTVSDTGIGMDQETVSHIFEPFFTTKEKGKGTGFGLSIVYGIVKQSGGYIRVHSEPGQGTTFRIYLPRAAAEQAKVVPMVPSLQIKHRAATILLVEDEGALAKMVCVVLESSGYKLLYAATADEALGIAGNYEGKIDLLLSDVILRGSVNGIELARELAATRPDTKLLFMSGYSDALNRADYYARHVLLEKPFTNVELRRRVQEALSGTAELGSASDIGVVRRKLGS